MRLPGRRNNRCPCSDGDWLPDALSLQAAPWRSGRALASDRFRGYELRDLFATDDAAPLTNPRVCEPGPGQFNVVDSGWLAISGGQLVVNGTPANNDGMSQSVAPTRRAGLAFLLDCPARTTTNTTLRWGWNTAFPGNPNYGFRYTSTTTLTALSSSTSMGTFTLGGGLHRTALVQRSTGCFAVVQSPTYGPRLVWVFDNLATNLRSTLVASGTGASNLVMDNWRVVDLPAPWNSDYGIVTQRVSGVVPDDQAFTHAADALIEFTVATLPASGQIEVRFRIQDASNYWQVTVDSSGTVDLDEVVAGTPTQRGTLASAISAAERVTIRLEASAIKVYGGVTQEINYASASNFATATSGKVETLGTGGVISDLIAWPQLVNFPFNLY